MAITLTQNKPATLAVSFTLSGEPGSVDTSTPIVWGLNPSENGVIVESADGMTAEVTMSVVGDCEVSVMADANLAGGVLDLVVTEMLTVAEAVVIGADSGTITEVVV